jgi:transposase-like protein
VPVIHINKIDWFQILSELSRSGYSLQDIAEELDVVASTLIGWKKGASPRHHTGEALIELWCRVTGKDRQELPKEKLMQKFVFHSTSRACRHSEK